MIFTTHDCLLQSWRHAIAMPSCVFPAHLHVPQPGPLRPSQPGRDWPVAAQTPPEAKAREGGAYPCRHSVAPPTEQSLYPPRKSSAWKLTLRVNGKCLKYLSVNKISKEWKLGQVLKCSLPKVRDFSSRDLQNIAKIRVPGGLAATVVRMQAWNGRRAGKTRPWRLTPFIPPFHLASQKMW